MRLTWNLPQQLESHSSACPPARNFHRSSGLRWRGGFFLTQHCCRLHHCPTKPSVRGAPPAPFLINEWMADNAGSGRIRGFPSMGLFKGLARAFHQKIRLPTLLNLFRAFLPHRRPGGPNPKWRIPYQHHHHLRAMDSSWSGADNKTRNLNGLRRVWRSACQLSNSPRTANPSAYFTPRTGLTAQFHRLVSDRRCRTSARGIYPRRS